MTEPTRHCCICGREVLTLADGEALPHAPNTAPGEPEVCLGAGAYTLTAEEYSAQIEGGAP